MKKPNVAFYLDKNAIYVNVRCQYNKTKINLKYWPGITIENEKDWNGGRIQRATDPEIQVKLDKIKVAVNDVLAENDILLLNGTTFTEKVNEKLIESELANRKANYIDLKNSFIEYAENFVRNKEANKDKVGNKDWKSIKSTVEIIKEFNAKLVFDQINEKFDEEFLEFLHEEKDATDNYIAKIYGNIKRILDKATKDKVNKKLEYLLFTKKKRREVFNVYLSYKQLEKLLKLKFPVSDDPKADWLKYTGNEEEVPGWSPEQYRESVQDIVRSYDNVRKLLIIGCWTGMRGGNYLKINPKTQIYFNDETDKYEISAVLNKGTGLVTIPMHRMIRHIFENETWPYTICQQIYNQQVKQVCRVAGFIKPCQFERYKGGKLIIDQKPFYKLVSSHTGRRSFCSNLLIAGVPKQYIMNFSGHKTEANFNKYTAHVTKDIIKAKASEHEIWEIQSNTAER